MGKLKRPNIASILAFSVLAQVLVTTAGAGEIPAAAEEMAKTYGLDSWDQIEGIRYTFNLEFPGVKVARSWEWEPKTGKITYDSKDKDGNPVHVTYLRSELSSQSDMVKNLIDPNFFNDQYWLLFPLHAVWDTSATVTDDGTQKLPLSDGSADRIVVKYPSAGGYYPGDTWELYVGADHRIQEMEFHRGSEKKPSLVIVTWAGYKKAGPLLFSTEHKGTADGGELTLTFTDVAVKLTGSDNWINAE
ncbi:MAG: hypothetical protein WAK31_19150 [Chthoniobacterales bacterium]